MIPIKGPIGGRVCASCSHWDRQSEKVIVGAYSSVADHGICDLSLQADKPLFALNTEYPGSVAVHTRPGFGCHKYVAKR